MGGYATGTSVSAERSRAEIEGILHRYGVEELSYGWKADGELIAFRLRDKPWQVLLLLPIPRKGDRQFTISPGGRMRTKPQAEAAWDQERRRRWRALKLVIQAKLEAVASGISTVEQEFLPFIVIPFGDGQEGTVAEWLLPKIGQVYEAGWSPPRLPMLESAR